MWEIINRDLPYKGDRPQAFAFNVSWKRRDQMNISETQVAQKGQILEIEKHCPLEWKQIMQNCWQMDQKDRPTFQQLADDLKAYWNQVTGKKILVKPSARKLKRLQEERRASAEKPAASRIITPDSTPRRPLRPSTPTVTTHYGSMQNLRETTSGKITSVIGVLRVSFETPI